MCKVALKLNLKKYLEPAGFEPAAFRLLPPAIVECYCKLRASNKENYECKKIVKFASRSTICIGPDFCRLLERPRLQTFLLV